MVTAGDPTRLTGGYLYNRRIFAALRAAGLATGQLVLRSGSPLAAASQLQAALAARRPALVVVDSIALTPAALALARRNRAKTPVLALMHMRPSDLAPPWRRPLARYLERRLLSVADRVVAVSPDLARRLVAVGARPDRVAVLPPGRDGAPAGAAPSPNLANPPPRDDRRLLCVANWSPSKGIDVLVQAMAAVPPPAVLDLVGAPGRGPYAARVRALIERHQLGERVRILGPCRWDDLGQAYAAADVFVLPSTSEGFGTAYAEAMGHRLPIVACRVGPLPWLVPAACGILVPPSSPAALAAALRALLADDALRRRLGDAAFSRWLELPTWDQTGDRFCRLVRDALDEGSPPSLLGQAGDRPDLAAVARGGG